MRSAFGHYNLTFAAVTDGLSNTAFAAEVLEGDLFDGEGLLGALDFVLRRGKFAGRDHMLPKLILLDVNMQKIGGLEALRELRSHAASKDIPVCILTSSAKHTYFFESQEMRVWDYLMKPVTAKALVDLVKQSGL